MGVQGLWTIIDSTGSTVELKSLEGLRLAIDVSIWIYQSEEGIKSTNKGMHLSVLINRICKLLHFKIRPVFVFDGPNIPEVKRQTLNARKFQRYVNEEGNRAKILKNFIEKQAVPVANKRKADDVFLLDRFSHEQPTTSRKRSKLEFVEDYGEEIDISSEDEIADLVRKRDILRKKRVPERELNKNSAEFSQGQLSRLLAKRKATKTLEGKMEERNNPFAKKVVLTDDTVQETIFDPDLRQHVITKKRNQAGGVEKVEMRSDEPSFSITNLQNFKDVKFTVSPIKKKLIDHQDVGASESSSESEWEDVLDDNEELEEYESEEDTVDLNETEPNDRGDSLPARLRRLQPDATDNDKYFDWMEVMDALGLPYIIAHGEAEAECVNLEKCNLVDGIVTEDSDVFLFGGRRVYRNMFSKKKELRLFKMSKIIDQLKYTRFSFIAMALFSSGDYCEGFRSIGIKTSQKIVAEFSKPLNSTQLKSINEPNTVQSMDDVIKLCDAFKQFFQTNKKRPVVSSRRMAIMSSFFKHEKQNNMALTIFPSLPAIKAYVFPECLSNLPNKFTWKRVNYNQLQNAFLTKIGWSLEEFHKKTFNTIVKWDKFMSDEVRQYQPHITNYII